MRIAIITAPGLVRHAEPSTTSDSQVPSLAAALAHRGHRLTLYAVAESPADEPMEAPAGVRLAQLPAGDSDHPRFLARYGAALAEAWHDDPPEVVHAVGCTAGLAVIGAQEMNGATAAPHVQDYRLPTTAAASEGDVRQVQLETALGRRAAQVLAASPRQSELLAARGILRSHLAVVPYGVDTDLYHPQRHRPTHHQVELSPPAAGRLHRVVCAAGCTDPALPDLVEALSRIPDAELIITGAPAVDNGSGVAADVADHVQDLAARYRVADRVQLLDRAHTPAGLDDTTRAMLYRSADLVVSGPAWAAAGPACVQAMACGAPLVTITPDGTDDTVLDGVSGELVPARRPRQLADTIRRLLADPARRNAYGIAGADRAAVCYSWDRVAARAEIAYTDATRRGHITGRPSSGRVTGISLAGTYQASPASHQPPQGRRIRTGKATVA